MIWLSTMFFFPWLWNFSTDDSQKNMNYMHIFHMNLVKQF